MIVSSIFDRLGSRIRQFPAAREGNAMMLFGFMLLPLIAAAGSAVDYGRASSARTEMQAALDLAALAVSRDAKNLSAAQINSKAKAYFDSMFQYKGVSGVTVTTTYTTSGVSQLTMNARGFVKTDFMGLFGHDRIEIGTDTTTKWGTKRLRVAMVLDNTGSMNDDGKLPALKSAALGMLSKLKSLAKTDGDVYVSLVPFAKTVNSGITRSDSPFLRWDVWDAGSVCTDGVSADERSCRRAGKSWERGSLHRDLWKGCVTDRDQDYDVGAAAATQANTSTQFPRAYLCPTAVQGLTSALDSTAWNALTSQVTNMVAGGNTNQTIGLQWGYQSLAGASPLSAPAKDANYEYASYIILLTDGLNTENRWSTSRSTIDQRTEKLCTNVKSAGVTLFTVQVNTGGDPTSAMLQRCASNGGFFLVTSAGGIDSAFDQIFGVMSDLRLSS
ncbi:Tad domain-containing protein [Labrys wisconsinensis]|uniref:Flp pilus assembly protein TadG n=1 Tax=Labrys wisconsinensis TaxID=425677 RepID=A0ABU0JH00_9HYPH|nr:Tad domain-containing protein [Labrys wisconsinensis]MDQ0473575.1 Flp pilus assembly protein TadG [Labrys wisconsinensis]